MPTDPTEPLETMDTADNTTTRLLNMPVLTQVSTGGTTRPGSDGEELAGGGGGVATGGGAAATVTAGGVSARGGVTADTETGVTAGSGGLLDGGHVYSPHEMEVIKSIEEEAAKRFPVDKEFETLKSLRDQVKDFGRKNGFAVTSIGNKICCTRCEEPQGYKNKKMRRTPLPEEKRRKRSSTRVGCKFSICYTVTDYKSKESKTYKRVKITKSSNYQHSNGCLPSPDQLAVETRKAGTFTVAIHEARIKSILAAVATNVNKVDTPLLREMIKPLFPPGTSLDSKLIFNFRTKIRRMLMKGIIDLSSYTITQQQENELLSLRDARTTH